MNISISETDLEDYLADNLDIIEPNLRLIRRQHHTKYGKIDLFCLDKQGCYVVIEIKLTPNTNSPGQLVKYIFSIKQENPSSNVRGILVAPKISDEIEELCNYFDLNFKELSVEMVLPTIKFPKPERTSLIMHRLLKRRKKPYRPKRTSLVMYRSSKKQKVN